MPITLVLKRSSVAGDLPLSTDMTQGELVLNSADNSLYHKAPGEQVRDLIQARISATLSIQGSNTAWLFSGDAYPQAAANPTLFVYRGVTYRFDNRANNATHPFQITTETGTTYTAGLTTHASGMITWTVPMNAPDNLRYRAVSYPNSMAGSIKVGGAGSGKLDDLQDVDTTTAAPTDNQALLYNAASQLWRPGPIVTTLAALTDVQTGNPLNGQVLTYNAVSGKWRPTTPAGAELVSLSGPVSAQRTLLDDIASQFNGTAAAFGLTVSGSAYTPQNVLALEVILGGIQQRPGIDYSVSGSTLTFADAPATGLNCLIIGTTYVSALFSRQQLSVSATVPSLGFANLTLAAGRVFSILAVTADYPAWIRVYGDTASRDADTRSAPGGALPPAGSAYFAEVVTTLSAPTVTFSPVPLVQTAGGQAYVRVQNLDQVVRTIALTFVVTTLEN